jgi:hypothetical protein
MIGNWKITKLDDNIADFSSWPWDRQILLWGAPHSTNSKEKDGKASHSLETWLRTKRQRKERVRNLQYPESACTQYLKNFYKSIRKKHKTQFTHSSSA